MTLNISSVGHRSLSPEQSTATQPSSLESPSPHAIQTTIQQEIQKAAQNLDQILEANTFATETNGTETTIHFGDGIHGEKPPSGSSGGSAYTTGAGQTGNQPTPDPALWVAIRNKTSVLR